MSLHHFYDRVFPFRCCWCWGAWVEHLITFYPHTEFSQNFIVLNNNKKKARLLSRHVKLNLTVIQRVKVIKSRKNVFNSYDDGTKGRRMAPGTIVLENLSDFEHKLAKVVFALFSKTVKLKAQKAPSPLGSIFFLKYQKNRPFDTHDSKINIITIQLFQALPRWLERPFVHTGKNTINFYIFVYK